MSVITQKNILNIVPGMSAPLVVHVSQGDSGVELVFTLVDGDEIFDPTGTVISVHGIRQDGNGWGPVACARENGMIKFTLPDAATAVKGSGMAEVVISNESETVGTTNFAILVETATFPQGVTYANDVSVYEAILAYVQNMSEQTVANVEEDLAAEIANRIAADAVLQGEINTNANNITTNANKITTTNGRIDSLNEALTNSLSAETTARQNADSSEAIARSEADALLQAEIDQLVAPSGEAPSAAEVENARVGADGVTYSTLGDANRSQFTFAEDSLKNITGVTPLHFTEGYYINTNSPVDVTNPTARAQNEYCVVDCAEGDTFVITAKGAGSSAHCYCFINSSGTNIESQQLLNGVTEYVLQAPANAAKLIINSEIAFGSYAYKGNTNKKELSEIAGILGYKKLAFHTWVTGKFIKYNGEITNNGNFNYMNPIYIPSDTWIFYRAKSGSSASAIAITYDGGTSFTRCKKFLTDGQWEDVLYKTKEAGYYSFSYYNSDLPSIYTFTLNRNNLIDSESNDIAIITGIVRNDGNGWAFISDSDHKPMNLSSVSVDANGNLQIDYTFTAKKVLSLVATPDETFAKNYRIGASVGLSSSTLQIYRLEKNVGGRVRYRSGDWNLDYATFSSYSWDSDTGKLKLYHDAINVYPAAQRFFASISPTAGSYKAEISDFGTNYTEIQFFDASGNVITTPSSLCDCILYRNLPIFKMDANDVVDANGNFWIIGVMEI